MSREKIEEMARDICECYDNGICYQDGKPCDLRCDSMTDSQYLYEKDYRKQEWISVDERLPEREGTYLTYTDKDKMIIDVFCIYPSHGTKFWVGGNGEVTHWMPLPEAPKMKGGAE